MPGRAHVFIFRRDLRVIDNHAWELMVKRLKPGDKVVPIFMFDKRQIDPKKNKYYSEAAARFMVESLRDLAEGLGGSINTYLHDWNDCKVLETLVETLKSRDIQVASICFNRDYTPFARERDEKIIEWCKENDVNVIAPWTDYALIDIANMLKGYKVFGAFLKKYKHKGVASASKTKHKIQLITGLRNHHYVSASAWDQLVYGGHKAGDEIIYLGGREAGLERMRKVTTGAFLSKYSTERNYPSKDGTSLMSAYLKFGCVSVREFYWAIVRAYGKNHSIINEMYWRAFYDQMVYWWPETLQGQISATGRNMNESWSNGASAKSSGWLGSDSEIFKRITRGECGVPIVDASIRCLKSTGFMHNRLRMVLCMLAVRICRVDWRVMERWFARYLIDYHPASNRGGWEWAVIYRFVLNPWVQTERFDRDCEFIKRWIPELLDVSNKDILQWHDASTRKKLLGTCKYKASPIVNRQCKRIV